MHFSLLIKEKKAEMSFLRVSDLLIVCVHLNHDADCLYIPLKTIFSLKINEKFPLEKCVCLLWKILTVWFPALKLKRTSNFVSAHVSHYVQIWLKEKCHLSFILFVYALKVHPLEGHMPNIDYVVCL